MSDTTVGELRAALADLRKGELARIVALLAPLVRGSTEASHALQLDAPAFPTRWQTSTRFTDTQLSYELVIAVKPDGTPIVGALIVDHAVAARLGIAYTNSRSAAMAIAATPDGARVTLFLPVLEQIVCSADARTRRTWKEGVAQSIHRQVVMHEELAAYAPGVLSPSRLQNRLRAILGDPTPESDHLDVPHAQQVLREFLERRDVFRLESRRRSPEGQEESLCLFVLGDAVLTVTRYEPGTRAPRVRLTLPGTGYEWEPADWGADFVRALDARRDDVRKVPGRYEIRIAGIEVAPARLRPSLWYLDRHLRRRPGLALALTPAWPVGYVAWLAWLWRGPLPEPLAAVSRTALGVIGLIWPLLLHRLYRLEQPPAPSGDPAA